MVNCTHNNNAAYCQAQGVNPDQKSQLEGTTPMTKNGTNSANSKQTVSVQSQGGENIGLTYPNRAAGFPPASTDFSALPSVSAEIM